MKTFEQEVAERIKANDNDLSLRAGAREFMLSSLRSRYSYNFSWLGRPIIQYPQDILAIQEIVWAVQPDLIVETGIAHGGSLIFSASLLELNASCGGPAGAVVLGIDIEIRPHNKEAILKHPLARRISMIEGSSIAPDVISQVTEKAHHASRVLVLLDSNHAHDHVLAELEAYAPLVTIGSYCVVFDTVVEDMPSACFPNRPWGKGNNPKTAVQAFLARYSTFEIDKHISSKLLVTVAPDGYLKRVR